MREVHILFRCLFHAIILYLYIAFLSYLRLSIYMAIVSVAITLSFHLKNEATPLELRMAKPLGTIFWGLSVLTLLAGMGNYISECYYRRSTCAKLTLCVATVNKYSKRAAIVQIGWKTHAVSWSMCDKRGDYVLTSHRFSVSQQSQ